jgi:hypothetical protein
MADYKKSRMTDSEAMAALERDPRAQELLELLSQQDSKRAGALMETLSEMEAGENDQEK